jgi:uridine phosphorylase
MEASVIMVLARIWGLRGGAISVVTDAVLPAGQEGVFDPQASFDAGEQNVERLARAGCETIRILADRDGR